MATAGADDLENGLIFADGFVDVCMCMYVYVRFLRPCMRCPDRENSMNDELTEWREGRIHVTYSCTETVGI
jgi:hypothetical protein